MISEAPLSSPGGTTLGLALLASGDERGVGGRASEFAFLSLARGRKTESRRIPRHPRTGTKASCGVGLPAGGNR